MGTARVHPCAVAAAARGRATRDIRKVSLWLEHGSLQSTKVYLRADPTKKLEELAALPPRMRKPGGFRASDKLLATHAGDQRVLHNSGFVVRRTNDVAVSVITSSRRVVMSE